MEAKKLILVGSQKDEVFATDQVEKGIDLLCSCTLIFEATG